MTKNYKIDFAKNTITVTKKFMEEAGTLNTPAFKAMRELRELGMEIVVRESAPRKSNKITYARMAKYISVIENSEFYMAKFDAVREEAKSKKDTYNRVLKWFNDTFPRFYDLPEFNANNEVVVKPADYPEIALVG